MNVCFETFGCRLNRAEALEDEAKCLAAGHRLVTDHQEADFFVIRGCSVTSRAQRDCEKLIQHLREKYPTKRVYVTGCLKEAKPLVIKSTPDRVPVPTRTARAYLKVQDGCSGKCAFCIIPRFRGESVSEGFTATLDKARRFIDAGYHEIVVTGCNLSLYADGGKRLPDLVAALAGLDRGCRVRLGSIEPHLAAEETIAAMAEHDNVCRFLHLAIQSGSDAVLQRMKRPYTAEAVCTLIRRARTLTPQLAVGADMIAGFPGEQEVDHLASTALLTLMRIVNVHAFPYSKRPGTRAAVMPNPLPHATIVQRAKALAEIGDTNRRAFSQRFLGQTVEVVVEKENAHVGWTGEYLWFEELQGEKLSPEPTNERKKCLAFKVRKVRHGRLYGTRV